MEHVNLLSFFPARVIAIIGIGLGVVALLCFVIVNDRNAMKQSTDEFLRSMKKNEICLVSVLLLIALSVLGYFLYQPIKNYNAAIQYQQKVEKAMGFPVYCQNEHTPSVKTDVVGLTVNFHFSTPLDRQWAIDYGDGNHTQVWLTNQVTPYAVTYTYLQAGEYTPLFLVYDPNTRCEARGIIYHLNLK
jgi:hypothetical protein